MRERSQRLRPSGGVGREHDLIDATAYAAWLSHADPAVVANALICLIHQANYLLDQQIAALERGFIQEGGYSESLAAARLAERAGQRERKNRTDPTDRTDPSDGAAPACPACGKDIVLRIARKGGRAGSRFWGCTGYPRCMGTRPLAVGE